MARELLKRDKESQNVEQRPRGSQENFWPSTYSPFGMMRRFADEMDRMFGQFGFPATRRFNTWGWDEQQRFSPELDMIERDGKLIIRADLPGLNKENVSVDVSEHAVTIEGERKCEHEENEKGVYTCERSYGHFRREIPLPEGVKTESAKANFKNGTLEITFDAPATSKKGRRVEIQDGGSTRGETAA